MREPHGARERDPARNRSHGSGPGMASPTPQGSASTAGTETGMHLVFVLPIGEYYSQAWTGAIATITRHVAGELTAEGHSVTVITPDDGAAPFAEGRVVRLRHGSAHPVPPL